MLASKHWSVGFLVIELISFIERNADWLFGSTSVAALALGVAKLYLGRSRKNTSDAAQPASSQPAFLQPTSFLFRGAVVVLVVATALSGYFVVTGGDYTDQSMNAGRDATRVDGGNLIQSGDRSTNIITDDSTVTVRD